MRLPAPLIPATLVKRSRTAGVEAIAYRCGLTCEGIEVIEPVEMLD
jgi:hypothetical protein